VCGWRVLGCMNICPEVGIEEVGCYVTSAFLGLNLLGGIERELPGEVIVYVMNEDFRALVDAIEELRGVEMVISHRVRGSRARWQQMA
ncbi:excinuclease ABC subunit C, partial [Pseudomonas syringae pv. tagetis]